MRSARVAFDHIPSRVIRRALSNAAALPFSCHAMLGAVAFFLFAASMAFAAEKESFHAAR